MLYTMPAFAISTPETFFLETTTAPSAVSTRFDNTNWFTSLHPKVATFTIFPDGSAEGMTVNGIIFTQYNVPNSAGIRVQRFEIQDHYHYIVEGDIVDSFEEFSARLALAYHAQKEMSAKTNT